MGVKKGVRKKKEKENSFFALKRREVVSRRSEILGQGRKGAGEGARFEETRKPFSHKKH